MSIEKRSLISTLKTTKKANVASAPAKAGGAKEVKEMTKARGFARVRGLSRAHGLTKPKMGG